MKNPHLLASTSCVTISTACLYFAVLRAQDGDQQIIQSNTSSSDLRAPLVDAVPPVGSIISYAGAIDPAQISEGVGAVWLLCDGRELPINQYTELSRILSSVYGKCSSVENFRIPDLRGRVPVGKTDMGTRGEAKGVIGSISENPKGIDGNSLGRVGGEDRHLLTLPELAEHNHDVDDKGHNHSFSTDSIALTPNGGKEISVIKTKDEDKPRARDRDQLKKAKSEPTNIKITTKGDNQPHNNIQPSIIVNYLIRAK